MYTYIYKWKYIYIYIYIYIYTHRFIDRSNDRSNERKWLYAKKARSRQYSTQNVTDTDNADDIVLLANTPTQVESLLHCLEQVGSHRVNVVFLVNLAHLSMYGLCMYVLDIRQYFTKSLPT